MKLISYIQLLLNLLSLISGVAMYYDPAYRHFNFPGQWPAVDIMSDSEINQIYANIM